MKNTIRQDREQKFVLRTQQWQNPQSMAHPFGIQQWYIRNSGLALQLMPELEQNLPQLARRGYCNNDGSDLDFDDSNLSFRIRHITPPPTSEHQDLPYYELTLKLYDASPKERIRQKIQLSENDFLDRVGSTSLQDHLVNNSTFTRYRIYHGHQQIDGKNAPLRWKIDVFNGCLHGLTLAKTEKSNGFISCIETPCGAGYSVTDDRRFTGYMLGQCRSAAELGIQIPRNRSLHIA